MINKCSLVAGGAECEAQSIRHSLGAGALGSEIGLGAQSVELGHDAGDPVLMAAGLMTES